MNKVLHVLVYVFLALASAALFFELQLNKKRDELTDRNRMQEDYLVKLARTIEKAEPDQNQTFEIMKDVSPITEEPVVDVSKDNVLEGYKASLEQANLETYNWDSQREGLRSVYVRDAEGNPVMDGNQFMTRGSDEDKLLEQLFNSAKEQQKRLNDTRAALAELRSKLEAAVQEINELKPSARKDKEDLKTERDNVSRLQGEKTELENQITKIKSQIDELNSEITSLKDEVATAKDEAEAQKEEVAKRDKMIENLKELLKHSIQTQGTASAGNGTAVTSLPAGDKGKIVRADNDDMFAIVAFTPEAMAELKGNNQNAPLPAIELSVKRPGFAGPAGEFVGRIRIRQEVKGKNYVICDILGNWEQDKLAKDDVIFAD